MTVGLKQLNDLVRSADEIEQIDFNGVEKRP
jgi:hypothetical protein